MILDIGCGNLPTHHSHGTINIDIKKPCNHTENFIQADGFHLPIKTGSVDKIICLQVIEHVENPVKFLKEFKRVLKKNASAIISTPNPLHWRRILYALRNREVETGFNEHINCWTQHELANLAMQADLYPNRIWFETPSHILHEKGFRYMLDRLMGKWMPKQLGKRHIWMEATNGS